MPRILIEHLDDPRLAVYRNLKATNETRHADLFVVEGEKLVERLFLSRYQVDSVLVTDRHEARIARLLRDDLPVFVVPESFIEVIIGFNFHRGVLACGRRAAWQDLLALAGEMPTRATIAVCPQIDNPENLGAIVRIADVFGIDAVVAGRRCPDPLSRRVLRVSMGTVLRVPVVVCEELASALDRLRTEQGFHIAATVVEPSAMPLHRFQRPERLAVLFGSEGHGLDPDWLAISNHQLTIPMRTGAESLNVALAAGLFLYHLSLPV